MRTKIKFDNQYVLSRIDENISNKKSFIIQELKQIVCSATQSGDKTQEESILNDVELLKVYDKSISIHQSKNSGNGKFLEDILVEMLDENDIPYRKQVTINNSGMIVGFNVKKKCYHIIDCVIGKSIEVGNSITEFIVISCKTTCRERWTQDNWSYTLQPKLYILLTISDDYPSSTRFKENIHRKIITCIPKKNDKRIHKLKFDDIIEEINRVNIDYLIEGIQGL